MKHIMSVDEIAEYLSVNASWVYKHYKELPHFKLGGLTKFIKEDIDAYIQSIKKNVGEI